MMSMRPKAASGLGDRALDVLELSDVGDAELPLCRRRAVISSTAVRPCFSVRVAIMTCAPSAAKTRAMPRPMPWPPPVTIATLPSQPAGAHGSGRLQRTNAPRLRQDGRQDERGAGDEQMHHRAG